MKFPNYALGLVTGFCLGCLYFMVPTLIKSFQADPVEPPPKSNVEVVDKYQGCDIIRWTQSNFAEYKYFLHCDK